ncbi:MAG: hypothetical protein JWR36_1218 [Glaciihabitans sp.]|jgi:hypothetical protein|nr:hypothetical protein [Glaciihabitans sp.]
MDSLMTKDAAIALGVSQRQVTDLLHAGKLTGEQLGDGTWLVSPRSIAERRSFNAGAGRTWSAASSWALLAELSGKSTTALSQSTIARIRRRIRTSSAEEIARKVATRTKVHRYTADSFERTASELVLTGKSAAHRIDSDLTRQTQAVEGYVPEGDLEEFVRRHLLFADENGDVAIYERSGELNVDGDYAAHAVIAADLARSTATRERAAGIAALEKTRQQWLATHTR